MPTRRYREGSLYHDTTKGLWVGTVELGRTPEGRRIRRKVSARTRGEARTLLRDLVRDQRAGALTAETAAGPARKLPETIGEWLDFWTVEILPGTVAPSTERMYGETVADWIKPHVAEIPLADLAPEHVVAMMRALEERGLAASTQKKARTILRRALTIAERYGRVSRNVAALTDAPKQTGTKLDDSLDAGDVAQVLDAARGDRLEALAALVLTVGMRKAEALDLRWADLNLDAGAVTVHGTKTTASTRTVALPPFVVAALRRHHTRQLEERLAAPLWGDPELVFTTSIGTAIHPRNVTRWWHELTTRAGVGRRRFHASRHTAATLMLNNGVPLEVVSATLGHAGLAITADVYAKVRPDLQRTSADAMQSLFGGSGV
jgi:integrase